MIPKNVYFRGQQTAHDTSIGATDQTLKDSPGQVMFIDVDNQHATDWAYLKLYDAASVTVASAVPTYSYAVPPASSVRIRADEIPMKFDTEIHYAAAQERAAGATAPTTALSASFTFFAKDT